MNADNAPHDTASPVMNNKSAARYLGRTPNALRILRHRRRGPKSWLKDGQIWYYVADLDAWLSEAAQADSRFNRDLDPTRVPAQTRGHRPSAAA